MKPQEMIQMGVPKPAVAAAIAAVAAAAGTGMDREALHAAIAALVKDPAAFTGHAQFGALAARLIQEAAAPSGYVPRGRPAPYRSWGRDLEPTSVKQMEAACELPVSIRGALMPDAHLGYGLPIGGVLATDNAVIPYAVGMDIACRMKLTVLDLPLTAFTDDRNRLKSALVRETQFGVGARFKKRRQHPVMDEDWSVSPVTAERKDTAWSQLGTSGSGNHFVEYGELTVTRDGLGLAPGAYLAILSHSGSRGTGGKVAQHYSALAQELNPQLPQHLKQLAWFSLDSAEGREYWAAMELMGRYAAAGHALIHAHIAAALGVGVLLDVENHHNFAWRENHDGREVIVHRKGATPASVGVLGIIPGSMGTPGYVVRGLGQPDSMNSASHGAGRAMSRKQAHATFNWEEAHKFLKSRNVEIISAGLDEVPMAYKDIDQVMAAQADLVETLAKFEPRIVKMAPSGERPED